VIPARRSIKSWVKRGSRPPNRRRIFVHGVTILRAGRVEARRHDGAPAFRKLKRPATVTLLAENPGAKPLAGGRSLMPILRLSARRSKPPPDLRRLPGARNDRRQARYLARQRNAEYVACQFVLVRPVLDQHDRAALFGGQAAVEGEGRTTRSQPDAGPIPGPPRASAGRR